MLHDRFRIQRIFSRWRVRPCFGEGARSYFSRLVMDGEELTPRDFAERSDMYLGGDPIRQILKAVTNLPITDEEKASLVRWTPMPAARLSSGTAPPRASRRSLRYCPQCIGEAPYHRSWWDVRSMTQCMLHGNPLRVGVGDTSYPFYGSVRGGLEVGRPPNSFSNDGSFDGYQLQRMGVLKPVARHPLLDRESFDAVGHLVDRVGKLLHHPKVESSPRASRAARDTGFEALGSNAEHLEKRFAEWLAANNTPEALQNGSLANYGWGQHIGLSLLGSKETKLYALVNSAQIRASSRHGMLARRLLRRGDLGLAVNFSQAAEEFNLTRHTFRMWLARAGITPTRQHGVETLADADLAKLRSEFLTTCTIEVAAGILQLDQSEMKSLGRYRILDYLTQPDKGDAGTLFFRPDVEGLIDRLQFPPPLEGSKPLRFKEFVRRSKRKRIVVARDVLEGRHPCYRIPGGLGFDSLRFEMRPRDHKTCRRGKPARPGRKDLSTSLMIRSEFTVLTGIPSRGIANLVKTGHLRSDQDDVVPLDRSVAIEFHRKYINAFRFLRTQGMKLAVANAEIERLGMHRAFDYEVAQAILIDRGTFEEKLGIEKCPNDQGIIDIWASLLECALRNCPSFVFPPEPIECATHIRTSTRKSGFMIDLEGGNIAFEVSMDQKTSSRLWKLYLKENELRSILPSFKWDSEESSATGRAVAQNRDDLDRITKELGKISETFAYKMP
jgi:hypothetical protein